MSVEFSAHKRRSQWFYYVSPVLIAGVCTGLAFVVPFYFAPSRPQIAQAERDGFMAQCIGMNYTDPVIASCNARYARKLQAVASDYH